MKRRDASALLLLGSLAASNSAGAVNWGVFARGLRSTTKMVTAAAAALSAEELAARRAAAAASSDAAAAHASERLHELIAEHQAAQAKAASGEADDLVFTTHAKPTATSSLLGKQAGRTRLLSSLSRLYGKRPRMVRASASAKRFGKEFLAGAKEGQARLEQLGPPLRTLVGTWLHTPKEKRVFIIGASADLPEIAKLRAGLEADGYATFFYKFCEPLLSRLCKSEDVGAFFATAGQVISVKSPAAAGSDYIPVELAASTSVLEGGALFITSPEDLVNTGLTGGGALTFVTVFELDASDDDEERHAS